MLLASTLERDIECNPFASSWPIALSERTRSIESAQRCFILRDGRKLSLLEGREVYGVCIMRTGEERKGKERGKRH